MDEEKSVAEELLDVLNDDSEINELAETVASEALKELDEPATDEPATDEPATDEPATDEPPEEHIKRPKLTETPFEKQQPKYQQW